MAKKNNFAEFEQTDQKTVDADKLLKKNIYDYGIDVIQDRALPDYRDGMKPAQRRLLWTAHDLKATWNNKTVKSARICGDCMGKYHPHASSYGSLVTMATCEYPLIHGQGNWGSLTDGPAADRYTEAKISQIGMKMLECNDVADMVPNYTGEFMEPVVIPSRFPNFFVNDCEGIAVGLKCSIPSHNLKEITDAMKVVLKKGKNTKVKDITKYLNGPDYKYGGKILSSPAEIEALYKNGEGTLKFECNYTLVPDKRFWLLTITGYCPGFNPNSFINKMVSLIDDGVVVYVNDCSTKDEPCRLEVMLKNEEMFEKNIHKHIICSKSYRFYAIERTKSADVEKDVDTKVLVPNMIDLMNMWLDWRRNVETQMCTIEKNLIEEKQWRAELRLDASKHLNIVMKSLEQDDPVEYLMENLPILKKLKDRNKAKDGAIYIGDQRVISLKKVDQNKTESDIKEYQKNIQDLINDINDIDRVVLRELDKLKPFFKDRKLIA